LYPIKKNKINDEKIKVWCLRSFRIKNIIKDKKFLTQKGKTMKNKINKDLNNLQGNI